MRKWQYWDKDVVRIAHNASMVDKKLETNIKKTKNFIEIWDKFHNIFKNAISENHISEDIEKELSSVRDLASLRYEDLMDSLGGKPLKRFIKSPAIYNVLSFEGISIMSDERLATIGREWAESFNFLHALLERLERKKRRIGGFNGFVFVIRKLVRGQV